MGLMQNNDPRFIRAQEEHAHKMFDNSLSRNTRINYKHDLYKFQQCGFSLPASPADIVKYLNMLAPSYNPRTLDRHLKAIRFWHKINDFIDPTDDNAVTRIRKGIHNTYGVPVKKAKAFTLDDMKKIDELYSSQKGLLAYRNNALMQVGFFGAFRRSELNRIKFEDLTFTDEGVEIFLPRSKGDQEGAGHVVALPYMKSGLCPVKILSAWLLKSGITQGYIFVPASNNKLLGTDFLKDYSVYVVVKNIARDMGFEDYESYSAHSLRRGFATEASKRGANMQAIMKHGRWSNMNTVNGYIQEACKFKDNATSFLDINYTPVSPYRK